MKSGRSSVAKAKNVTPENAARGAAGDVWTFVAIDADSKLVLSGLVGLRDSGCATEFMQDVAARLTSRIQLTSDGNRIYLSAVDDAFGGDVDYSMLIKLSGPPATAKRATARPGASGASRRTS